MNRFSTLALLGAVLLAMGGCAGPREAELAGVTARDQHLYMPLGGWDLKPAVIVNADRNGFLVGMGSDAPPPAVAAVVQDGQPRLVSRQTLAAMRQAPGSGAMGSGPGGDTAPPAAR